MELHKYVATPLYSNNKHIKSEVMNKDIEQVLIDKNTRPTSMRILVYKFLNEQMAALSLSEIEEAIGGDRITVYRTLKTFEEKGLVHSIQEDHTSKYILCEESCSEHNHEDHHLHFYCRKCKQTTCREDVQLPTFKQYPFKIEQIQFFAKGICEECLLSS